MCHDGLHTGRRVARELKVERDASGAHVARAPARCHNPEADPGAADAHLALVAREQGREDLLERGSPQGLQREVHVGRTGVVPWHVGDDSAGRAGGMRCGAGGEVILDREGERLFSQRAFRLSVPLDWKQLMQKIWSLSKSHILECQELAEYKFSVLT